LFNNFISVIFSQSLGKSRGKMSSSTPLRTCCGCHAKKPALALQRITLQAGLELRLDQGRKAAGRGAYLCRNARCLQLAMSKKAFHRAFRTQLVSSSVDELARRFHALLRNEGADES